MTKQFVAALVVCCLFGGVAFACPSCREAVAAESADGPNLAAGFAASIALMLAMPLAIVGLGVWAARNVEVRRPIESPDT